MVVAGVLFVAGVLQIVFRRWLASESVAFQRSFWGFRFGPWAEGFSEKMALVTGALFICLGTVLALTS